MLLSLLLFCGFDVVVIGVVVVVGATVDAVIICVAVGDVVAVGVAVIGCC